MKLSLGSACAYLLVAALSGCSAPVGDSGSKASGVNDTAVIYFAGRNKEGEPDGKNTCSFKMEKGTYKFVSHDSCKNDDYYYYRFDNAPSATLIGLFAENDCRAGESDNDWNYTLRIYINPTSTEFRKLNDLEGLEAGDIVTRGVMVQRGKYRKGDIGGKLSCVIID